ncbi:hypothetical protein H7Y21_02465, partial [Arenimonas sp.]|nr:hypothetical protein [Candidatus Parcubacteria bacterium]
GPVYIASVAFHNTIDSRDNISAQYIAEEVIEVIRNKRDGYILNHNDNGWLNTIIDTLGTVVDCNNEVGTIINKCEMNKGTTYTFSTCTEGTCQNISFDPDSSNEVYGKVDIDSKSKFTREFYFQTYKNSDGKFNEGEVKLVVNINWEDKGKPKTYSLTERLYSVNYKSFFKPDPVTAI